MKTECQHQWSFDQYGYSYCELCGSARSTGKCCFCGKEQLNCIIVYIPDKRPVKYCSKQCLAWALEDHNL